MTTTKTRRTKSAYEELLAEQERSGLTLRALAEARGIPAATLYSWSRRLRRRASTAEYGGGFKLVELNIVPGPVATGRGTRPGTVARSLLGLGRLGSALADDLQAPAAIEVHGEGVRLMRALAGLPEGFDEGALNSALRRSVGAVVELARGLFSAANPLLAVGAKDVGCGLLAESERLLAAVVAIAPSIQRDLDVVVQVLSQLCPDT